MKRLFVHAICLLLALSVQAEEWSPAEWPVLKHYDQNHLYHIAYPWEASAQEQYRWADAASCATGR